MSKYPVEEGLSSAFSRFRADVDRTWDPNETAKMDKANAAMGLTGEAGEASDVVKKEVFQGHPENRAKLRREMGDTLFYFVKLMDLYGFTLYEIIEDNIQKRAERYPNGFTTDASINRKDRDK